jgi:hypothetical protein
MWHTPIKPTRWKEIISEQVKKIVGHTAPPEYIQQVGSSIDSVYMYVCIVIYSVCIVYVYR